MRTVAVYGIIAILNIAHAVAQTTWSLPVPWSAQDIGNPAIAGSTSVDQGQFTIAAAGTDIWGRADQFTFVYQQVTGDVDVIARVDSVTLANNWSKAGVMIRGSLAADAAHGVAFVSAGKGVAFQRRQQNGGLSANTYGPIVAPPGWVRLVRLGTTVTAYFSTDGSTWSVVGSSTVALGATAYVGLATTSHNASAATTAVMSQVSVVPLSLPDGQQAMDIGAPTIKGSVAYRQGVYNDHAGGADIWGTSDQFHFVYQPVSGDVEVTARVASVAQADSWSKTGVMIRETLSPDSRHAFALSSAGKGYAYQRRIDTAGLSQNTSGVAAAPPGWVRLVRTGSQIEAFQSLDGTTWTSIGQDTIPMADTVYVGIATTSHNTAQATDAVIDTLTVAKVGARPNRPPQVSITTPADGATFTAGNDIPVAAAASDQDGTITSVVFFAGSTPLGNVTAAPYALTWWAVPAGTYSLTAVATDDDGATTTSPAVSIRVDPAANQPPTITLTAPATGATYTAPATVTMSATASDPDGTIARVEFYNGSTLLNTDTAAPYTFAWSAVPAGTYGIRAIAYDNSAASAPSSTASITVTAPANQPPTATLTAPANGASYTAPAAVTMSATASDADGTIARVEFYNGATLLNTDTTAPYAFTWSAVAAGTYAIRAVAYDTAGASATSATATITVANAPSSGLISAYGLNEGSGPWAFDDSGNGWAGAISGATWTGGRYGQALSFDGSDVVSVGDLDLPGSFTVMGWLMIPTLYTDTCGSFVMKALDYGIEVCGGRLYGNVGANSVWTARLGQTLTSADLNVWKHVALTYDGATARFFIDGVLSQSASVAHGTNNNPLVFGYWTTPASEYWNGLIDEVRLYGRGLTQAEIQTDMNTPIGGGAANQPPTATLTAPANGATYTAPATVSLSASATDADGTIARVEFYNGTTLLNADTTAPFAFTWSSVAAGTYAVRAVAFDNAGASGTSATATITVTGPNQPPTSALTAPANGATYTAPATVTLSATASDADGTIARVEFYNGTTLLNTDTTAPYAFTWSSVPVGTYAIRATAYDNSGASATSATATITVTAANQPPTVTLSAPANGASYVAPATVSLSASATDPDGTIARVEFYNGATLLNSDTVAPYAFTWSPVSAGTYALRAIAYDNSAASATSATATITVTATNQPPTVTLTAPANGASYVAPATVSLTASAADADGTIARVEFYNGTTLLNSDTVAPYAFTWSSVAAGSYGVRAVAYDSAGASASSATATITVTAAGLPAGQQDADIGAPALSGSATYSGGSYTITAGGAGIWGTADQFHYVYQAGTGDMDVKLHVASVSAAAPYSSAGVMIRESLAPGSKHAFMLLSAARGYSYNQRLLTDGDTQGLAGAGPAPGWVRLTRVGSLFTAYRSNDGVTWTQLNSVTVTMTSAVYVGIAVTADIATARTTAVADNFSVTQGTPTNQAPTVTLTAPANGATYTAPATVALSASATDADGTIARVEFYNGATLLNSDTVAPYAFTWSSVAAGTYGVRAVAYDNGGASATSSTATITVAGGNQAPTVTLTAPANGATYAAPATVSLSASATDADGTIARVEFYNGTTLLNTDTTAPYAFTWSSVPVGTYAIRAMAYDNTGASATSATSSITVSTTATPPTGIVFQASVDHATLVTRYELRIFASGANPATATPLAVSDLGKPAPAANGDITVDRAAFFGALAPGSYVAAVAAIGTGGTSISTGVAFTR